MSLAAAAGTSSEWVTVLLAVLGVMQTVALAIIADRSRRVRTRRPLRSTTRSQAIADTEV